MTNLLSKVASGETLSGDQAADAMHAIVRGEFGPEQVAGLLLAITARGPTVEELAGFTTVMREYAVPVRVEDPNAVDLCGTGGDGAGLFNVSTAASFVCAAAGCTVAKHGNRSISSKCGSADVLEALGIETSLRAAGVEHCIEEAGIGFIFAPFFHPAMKNVMPVRRALGVRTFFNLLGPLCNPAGVRRQLVGAFSTSAAEMIAGVLAQLGADHAIAVHSEDGLDEISISAPTKVFEFEKSADREARSWTFSPESVGLSRFDIGELSGGDAERNAAIVRGVLSGQQGGAREIVSVNAALAIRAGGLADNITAALEMAHVSIDSGAAMQKLTSLRKASHSAPSS